MDPRCHCRFRFRGGRFCTCLLTVPVAIVSYRYSPPAASGTGHACTTIIITLYGATSLQGGTTGITHSSSAVVIRATGRPQSDSRSAMPCPCHAIMKLVKDPSPSVLRYGFCVHSHLPHPVPERRASNSIRVQASKLPSPSWILLVSRFPFPVMSSQRGPNHPELVRAGGCPSSRFGRSARGV